MTSHNHSCCSGKNQTSTNESASAHIDPVCKMTVDPTTVKNTLEHDGRKFYFCCAGCLKKFVAAPDRYL